MFHRNRRHNLVHDGIFVFNARNRFVVGKVVHIFLHVGMVLHLVALVVGRFQSAQVVGFRTAVFACGESVAAHAFHFGHHGLHARQDGIFFAGNTACKGSFGACQDKVAVEYRCLDERGFSLLHQFGQTCVQHTFRSRFHIVHGQVTHVVLHFGRHGIVLVAQVYDRHLLFLVLGNGNQRFVVVGHRILYAYSRICRHFDGREHLLDFCLNLVHIHVAHYQHTLQVRTVPFLIIVAQCLIGEVVHYLHRTDRQTVCILAALVQCRQCLFVHTHHGSHARTPFLVNHATFLVYLFRVQCQVVGPVVQHQQTRVDDAVAYHRHVGDVVHRLVQRGICIQVLAELHADFLQILPQQVAGEMRRTVKAHVLQEVRQTALVVLFQNGTHVLRNVEIGPLFGQLVMADVIRQSVFQFPDTHVRVGRDRGQLLCKCSRRTSCQKDDGKCFFDNVHDYKLLDIKKPAGGSCCPLPALSVLIASRLPTDTFRLRWQPYSRYLLP